jgi:hypothetical protein
VGQHDAVERDRAEAFGALVVAFLGRGQQRMQHLDRRLEHLDELEQAAVGQAQAAGIAVGVRVVLRKVSSLRMSTLPTSDEMSWLFSSPGSVLDTAICDSTEGAA